jgi:hypothetical protein
MRPRNSHERASRISARLISSALTVAVLQIGGKFSSSRYEVAVGIRSNHAVAGVSDHLHRLSVYRQPGKQYANSLCLDWLKECLKFAEHSSTKRGRLCVSL